MKSWTLSKPHASSARDRRPMSPGTPSHL
jgi:hypothetical protein